MDPDEPYQPPAYLQARSYASGLMALCVCVDARSFVESTGLSVSVFNFTQDEHYVAVISSQAVPPAEQRLIDKLLERGWNEAHELDEGTVMELLRLHRTDRQPFFSQRAGRLARKA